MSIFKLPLCALLLVLVCTFTIINATAAEQIENTIANEVNDLNRDDIVMIVNLNSSVEMISANEARMFYLGKSRKFPAGGLVKLASLDQLTERFNETVLRKSTAQVDSIWSRLRFSGRAKPPISFNDPEELVNYVSNTKNAIGFVLRSSLNLMVKPVLSIKLN